MKIRKVMGSRVALTWDYRVSVLILFNDRGVLHLVIDPITGDVVVWSDNGLT